MKEVASGRSYLTLAVSKQVVENYLQRLDPAAKPTDILMPRHREILQAVAEGKTTKEIARAFGISVKTVDTHRKQLMERLNIYDIPGLVRYAMRAGMVPPET